MHITKDGLRSIAASVTELNTLVKALVEDATRLNDMLLKEPSAFWMRAFTRAFFAMVEGTIFGMKQTILTAWAALGLNIPIAELAILFEEGYDVKDNGDAKVQTKFLRLQNNLRFTVKMYAKVFEYNYTLDVQGDGWQAFNRSIDIRHRLTHPKRVEELNISIEDVEDIQIGFSWYMESVGGLVRAAAIEFAKKTEEQLSNGADTPSGT
jgi:hypothetical protein